MTIRVANISLALPVLLAPMAGITDRPFRRVVARFGAGLMASEMVASAEVVRAHPEARARAELGLSETGGGVPTAVQLAGREPHWMAEAARLVESLGARIIDINMGCPAKRVTSGLAGAALLRDLPLALRLIEAVVGAVKVPVTLKTRLGWDCNDLAAPDLARSAEAAGIAAITIHGRTRTQFYTGRADWAAIAAVRDAVRIPVIANGDITDAATARAALDASGADAVMIGRGAQGRPWEPARIAAQLAGRTPPPPPRGPALAALVAEHHDDMLSFYGRDLGLRVARKHLGWYMDAAGTPAGPRRALLTETDPDRVARMIGDTFAEGALAA